MSESLPSHPNLDWLRKTAKQKLKEQRTRQPAAQLADAQLALAREYGFSSWRSLSRHVQDLALRAASGIGSTDSLSESDVAAFLHAVGSGKMDIVRARAQATPQLANAVGPHPFWSGRPQALHVSIETSRRDMFDFLLLSGADVDGSNETYEHSSPLMLTFLWKQPGMKQELLARGARVGLVEALLMADDERVARMLNSGRSALPRYNPNGGSILAMARTPFAIDRLLDLGVSRDMVDRWGTPPLEAMSRLGPEGMPLVRHLLTRGFEAGATEYARMGDRESLMQLMEADPEHVQLDEVFRDAAGFGHHDLVEWLLTRGANVNAGSSAGDGWTALHSAAWEGDLRMVKLLVAAGADVSVRESGHNSTPAGCAHAAREATNNPECQAVADYLESAQDPGS